MKMLLLLMKMVLMFSDLAIFSIKAFIVCDIHNIDINNDFTSVRGRPQGASQASQMQV